MINCVKLSLTELFPLTAGAPAITLTPPEQSDTYKLHTQLKFQFQVTTLSATLYSGESTLVRRERERERERARERERERVKNSMRGMVRLITKCTEILRQQNYWFLYFYNTFRQWMDRMLVLRILLWVNS